MNDDLVLLERLRCGERQAWAEAYDAFSPALYRYAYRLLGDADPAEECVAETFSRMLDALRRGKGPRDHLRAYLYRSAHNWITDFFYRRKPTIELPETQAGPDPLPESEAVTREDRAHLRSALSHLSAEQRQVIALKFLEEWDNEQVAHALNKPVGAVKSLQHRALASLKRLLSEEDGR